MSIHDVALDLLCELARSKRRVETRAVQAKLTCILFELVSAERRLVTEKYRGVFPILTLLARGLGSFSSFEALCPLGVSRIFSAALCGSLRPLR